jgi:hypothetical protein
MAGGADPCTHESEQSAAAQQDAEFLRRKADEAKVAAVQAGELQ